jgi:hypothetical chaperone protein
MKGIPMQACGLDFGTSNSAIGVVRDGAPVLVPADDGTTLFPSAVFFDAETQGRVLYGAPAIAASVGQVEGRLMRSLKSILGSSLIEETTMIGKARVPLSRVIEIFVAHLKERAEAFAGTELTRVVHGRPVHFVDGDPAADARAEDTLRGIAERVGFTDVRFVYEPIAAAAHYERTVRSEELVLVADIGGGTTDIALIRVGPGRAALADRTSDILASSGGRVGGTDFDAQLSLASVMPLLGLGTTLVEKSLPMPSRLYHDLATWASINFVYSYANAAEARELQRGASEPAKLARLVKTIAERHGHRIAFAVEDGKIRLGSTDETEIMLGFLEDALAAEATRARFEAAIADRTARIGDLVTTCLGDAGVSDVATVFLTGGSCRVPAVRDAVRRVLPEARIAGDNDLLSVALGLTEAARRLDRIA